MTALPKFTVGFLVFPDITQLDLTGPWEVLSALPDTQALLVWKDTAPVRATKGLRLVPDVAFADCPQLDLICIPGGPGMNPLLTDDVVLDFVRRQAKGARYITSVCTGALVLGAAGLLKGKRAATHWMSRDLLAALGAMPVDERVVVDGNIITGGGVTAGIDFALRIAADLHGDAMAQTIQLAIEYDPAPPFDAGSPATAPAAVVDRLRAAASPMQTQRVAQVQMAAAKLNG